MELKVDKISRVEIFIEVARHGSFSKAARSLGMTGPALSKQVRKLEQQLGVLLFQRTTRQVTLTEEGQIYFQRAGKAMEDLREAEHQLLELKASPTGSLKVSVPSSFGKLYLKAPIAEFASKYLNVRMEVDFDDSKVDLVREGYDVAVRIGVLEDSSLMARELSKCPIGLYASKQFVEQHGEPKSPEDLKNFPAILFSQHGNISDWNYKSSTTGEIGTVALSGSFRANSAEMMLEACLNEIGLVVLPVFSTVEHLESGELIQLLPQYTSYPERGIYAIYPQNRYLATRVRLFVDHLLEYCKSLPW